MEISQYEKIRNRVERLERVVNSAANGGGNPYHDAEGKFTTGPSKAFGDAAPGGKIVKEISILKKVEPFNSIHDPSFIYAISEKNKGYNHADRRGHELFKTDSMYEDEDIILPTSLPEENAVALANCHIAAQTLDGDTGRYSNYGTGGEDIRFLVNRIAMASQGSEVSDYREIRDDIPRAQKTWESVKKDIPVYTKKNKEMLKAQEQQLKAALKAKKGDKNSWLVKGAQERVDSTKLKLAILNTAKSIVASSPKPTKESIKDLHLMNLESYDNYLKSIDEW